MLTQREVIPYLLRRGLVSAQSIVEGDLVVADMSRRNRNFRVTSTRGPCYLLKQGVTADAVATVANETAVYRRLRTEDSGFDRFLPGFYGYDPDEKVLILEFVRDAENLREYYRRCGRFSKRLAAVMGKALGTLHRRTQMENLPGEDLQQFDLASPWILTLHRPGLGLFRDVSNANLRLVKILQQFTAFCDLLDEVGRTWKPEALIHFDIKWDNCLVAAGSASGRKTGLIIVDWELAGFGDPCWDVGSVFCDYLSFWLLSIPVTGEAPPERFVELARYPLGRMQPALRAFWRAYVRDRALDTDTADAWLLRSVRYAAARLVQTAYELMQMSMQLTGTVICVLQLSLNMLRRPREATVQLLGIPWREQTVS